MGFFSALAGGKNTYDSWYWDSVGYVWSCFEHFSVAIPRKMKYIISGEPACRFSCTFLHFPSAIPAEKPVHTNFRLVHLNKKFDFLRGFGLFASLYGHTQQRKHCVFYYFLRLAQDDTIQLYVVLRAHVIENALYMRNGPVRTYLSARMY